MVFDLNKCIGCHTCSMACKTAYTDREPGQQYMYWNNVETQPGRGYPRNYAKLGGGFIQSGPDAGKVNFGPLPSIEQDYGAAWEYNYGEVMPTEQPVAPTDPLLPAGTVIRATTAQLAPSPDPAGPNAYSMNWDEDVGEGRMPNSYYFYLPRICNHCTKPACLASCPRQSIYKRAEDGIVLIDQDRCEGYRYCTQGCPYKKPFFMAGPKKSQKCIFCYQRLAQGQASFCFTQCTGRIRFVGYWQNPADFPATADDFNGRYNVNRLIDGSWVDGRTPRPEMGVALRLYPEFGTEPNLFYVPPLSPPRYLFNNSLTKVPRIPVTFLAELFGDNAQQTRFQRIARVVNVLEILKAEFAKGAASPLVSILTAKKETGGPGESCRLQLFT
jgi:DMSO reductase family type II enzyme iron-sulfur subunit